MTDRALHSLSLTELSALLQRREISSVELAQSFLKRIEAASALNAFLARDAEVTLQQARRADERRARGEAALLLGVPIAHKDVIVTRDFPTTAASKMLAGYRSPFDAAIVERLSEAGMVCLGKLNCDEFAMGSSNERSAFGAVLNPWGTARVPGGSSGGSAAAVAARLTPAASGTDTGGSIRQPAAFCGVTGIKPSYGALSRFGLIAYASSLDQAGFLAQSAEDCALLLEAALAHDPERDATSLPHPAPQMRATLQSATLKGLRIGLPKEFFAEQAGDAAARDTLMQALADIERLGAQLVEISLPRVRLAVPVYYILASAEASANLSRYDGVRYGHRCESPQDLEDLYCRSRSEAFGAEVQRRIIIGAYVLSHGYYDAYYAQAQKIRRLIAEDFLAAFSGSHSDCDCIAAPVSPVLPWRLGEHAEDPLADYLADLYTLPASLAGLPALSLPVGLAEGLPVGMQLIAPYFAEARLLGAAHSWQQETDWHRRTPPFAQSL